MAYCLEITFYNAMRLFEVDRQARTDAKLLNLVNSSDSMDRSIHPCLCFFQALFWRWGWKNWIEEFLFLKLVLIHPGHKCWHQVLFKWPQNALRPVVLVHSMHSCCRSTRKKRDRCNSPSEEGDRSPSHSSSCLWWWWTIRVDCVIHLQSRVMGPPSASQLQNGKPVSKIWQHVRLTQRNLNGPTKF